MGHRMGLCGIRQEHDELEAAVRQWESCVGLVDEGGRHVRVLIGPRGKLAEVARHRLPLYKILRVRTHILSFGGG